MPSRARTLVQASSLVTENADLQPGALIIEDGIISQVGSPEELSQLGDFDEIVGDPRRGIALPGFINAHHHSLRPNRLARASGPLELRLVQMRRRQLPPLTPEELFDQTLYGAIELLKTGVTGVVDLFPGDPKLPDLGLGACLDAYLASGLRVALCPRASDGYNFTYEPDDVFMRRLPEQVRASLAGSARPFDADRYFKVVEEVSGDYDNRDGRIRIGYGPVGMPWCSDKLLKAMKDRASDRQAPVQTHLLESPYQVAAARDVYGESVVRHLSGLGFLDELTSCAHGVWLSAAEMEILAGAGSVVVHDPSSNLMAACGVAPAREIADAGCDVGLGLDASGFQLPFDFFKEMQLALLMQQRTGWRHDQVDARTILRWATAGGSRALGLPHVTGTLTVGSAGDVVLVDLDRAEPWPYRSKDLVGELLASCDRRVVDTVIAGGRVVIAGGSARGVNEAELRERVAGSISRFLPMLDAGDDEFERTRFFIDEYFAEIDLTDHGVRRGGINVE